MTGVVLDAVTGRAIAVSVCDSSDHAEPVLATVRMHLAQGPADYCQPCAEWARKVYDALGAHAAHEEILPPPQGLPGNFGALVRGIDLNGPS